MKRVILTTIVVAGCLMIIGVGQLSAQTKRAYSYFADVQLGFAVTPEDFTDYYSSGYGIGAGVEYPVSPTWSLVGLFNLKFFGPAAGMIKDWWTEPDEYPLATNIQVSEGKLTAGTIGVLGKGCLKSEGSRLFPYVKGGFGITISGADAVKVAFDTPYVGHQEVWQAGVESQTNISIILGLGLEKVLGTGKTSLFVDGGLHMILQDNANPSIAPITVGLKF